MLQNRITLLRNQILKNEWGFKGVVVSDWASVYSTIGPVKGGLDIEMANPDFMGRDSIMKYLAAGMITREQIVEKARREPLCALCCRFICKRPER